MMGVIRLNLLSGSTFLMALILALPASVRAGCTHPWVQTTVAPSSTTDLAFFGLTEQSHAPRSGNPESPDRSTPCARGACSQPIGLPPVSTMHNSSRVELWGEIASTNPFPSPMVLRLSLEQGCDRPLRAVSPIERPPRSRGNG